MQECCLENLLTLLGMYSDQPLHTLVGVNFLQCRQCCVAAAEEDEGQQQQGADEIQQQQQQPAAQEEEEQQQKEEQDEDDDRRLPQDLILCAIVSRLPLLDLFRARSVSKAWRDFITFPCPSPSRLRGFPSSDCLRPRLVLHLSSPLGHRLAFFDPCLNRWSSSLPSPPPPSLHLVHASAGLFCFTTSYSCAPDLLVGNPLTNQWRRLPRLPTDDLGNKGIYYGPPIVAIAADPVAGCYQVFLLLRYSSPVSASFVYQSSTGRWERRSDVATPPGITSHGRLAESPGIMHCLSSTAHLIAVCDVTSRSSHSVKEDLRRVRHLASGIYPSDLQLPAHLSGRRLPAMVGCNGRHFLVARLSKEASVMGLHPVVEHRPLGIWVLQPDLLQWEFLTETPQDLFEQAVKGSDGTDFIVGCDHRSLIYLILTGASRMLAYDTLSSTWSALPGCPAEYLFEPSPKEAYYGPLLWTAPV